MNGENASWGNVLKMNTPTLVALAAILITMFSLKADIQELRQDIDRKLERIDTRLDEFGERIAANTTRLDAMDQ